MKKNKITLKSRTALIVLPAGVTDRGNLTYPSKKRIDQAVDIWNGGCFEYFIVCGNQSVLDPCEKEMSEAEAFGNYAIKKGVPKSRILHEDKSDDTVLNIIEIAIILRDMHIKRCMIVTSTNHVKRVRFICQNIVPDLDLEFRAVDDGFEKQWSRRFKEYIVLTYTKAWFFFHKNNRSNLESLKGTYLNSSISHSKGIKGRATRWIGRTVFYPPKARNVPGPTKREKQ